MDYQLNPILVTAKQWLGTPESAEAIEKAFGAGCMIQTAWGRSPQVNGQAVALNQWIVRFSDTGKVSIYGPELFALRFSRVA